MSFIIKITPQDATLINSSSDLQPFAEIIYKEICERKLYQDYASGCNLTLSVSEPLIFFTFPGMAASNESADFIVREISMLLSEIGLSNFIFVSGCIDKPEVGNKIFDFRIMKPDITRNSSLLDKMKLDSDIPDQYLCQLSGCIMDEPIYIRGLPETKYDYASLKYWIFQQATLLNPHNRQPISIADIIFDSTCKNEIKEFIEKKILSSLQKKHTLKTIISRHTLPRDTTSISVEVAFRRAAAINHATDLEELIKQNVDVDSIDNNPDKMKAAIHWASQNGHLESLMVLVKGNANINKTDARGNTPLHLAIKNKHLNCIKYLIDAGADLTIRNNEGLSADECLKQCNIDLETFLQPGNQTTSMTVFKR